MGQQEQSWIGPRLRRPRRNSSFVSQARRWVQFDRSVCPEICLKPTITTTSSAMNEMSILNHHVLLTSSVTTTPSREGGGSGVCVICVDASSEAVCVPCGHVAGCVSCLKEIQNRNLGCPVCRANIDQVIKLYHV